MEPPSKSERLSTRHRSSANAISRAHVVSAYQSYAPVYDFIFGPILEPGRQALTREVARLDPERVLEIGVGTGLTLAHYPASPAITGIDLSEEMLVKARERAAALPDRRIALLAMDAEALSFPSGHFDCVTIPYVLSTTPNPGRLIVEARRVCKRSGTIFILNHFSGSRFWWVPERAVRSLNTRIGFRSDFNYSDHILAHDWQIRSVSSVNLFGLSKLIEICNDSARSMQVDSD